jgi:hypothetical protein
MKKLRNILLSGAMATTLTACGGGGSGGAIGSVSNFVQEDLSSLTGSESIISSYSSLLSGFNSTISSGSLAGLSAIITGPTEKDITKAGNLLTMLNQAETLWSQTIDLIESQDTDTKLQIYNSDDYKNAHAALLYLQNHVKPVIQKVSQGQKLSLTEYNKVASDKKAEEIIKTEKENTVATYVSDKKTKINEEKQIEIAKKEETKKEEVKEVVKKEVKEEIKKEEVVEEKKEEVAEVVKVEEVKVEEVKVEEVKEVVKEEVKEVVKVETTNVEVDVREGYSHLDVTHGDTVVTTEELVTTEDGHTVTTLVTHSTRAVFHEHIDYKDTVTITTYKDGSVKEDVVRVTTGRGKVEKDAETTTTKKELNRVLIVVKEEVKEEKKKEVKEEKKEEVKEVVKVEEVKEEVKEVVKVEEVKIEVIKEEKKEIVKTFGHQFRTTEFNKDTSKSIINADKAYARGWTGKGSVLGVIDSHQDTDHEALDGKYKWYNNYVRYEDGTKDANGNELGTVANGGKNISHGTHVAGIVAGKRDGTEFHGVAFDAELVGANIDYNGSGSAHMSYASNALQDITKLKSTTAQGGEGMNIVAVNMSFNKNNANYHYGTVTQLSDGTYSAPKITQVMTHSGGGAQYWKVATDNGIVLVNSAGNGLYVNGAMNYDYALDPGIWATQTDANGKLVLEGKMIIVGNWGGTKADGQVVGSRAGHVCLNIVNNACNDTYKTSDFYILAPGNSVYSSVPGDGYATMGGSSMAAPQVTGAMGILHQMWPHMKGENLVKLVLNTADTNINGYNENIHGQGMLDLDEATQPQGAIGIPTTGRVDGTVTTLNNTYFATGSAGAFSNIQGLKIMVLDDYDRDYYINLGSSITVQDNRKYSDTEMLMVNNNTFLPVNQSFGNFAQGGQYSLLNNYNFGLYTGENGSGDYSANIGKSFMLSNNFKLNTSVGQMSEQETWLGNSSDGILAVGDNNNTNFGNLGVEYALGNNVLSLDYTKGQTGVNTTSNSLIKNFSNIETESYRLAYEIHKDTHTTFGWSFSLPSHITSGTMDLEVAESVNLDGTINYKNIQSDLTQSTKEKNLGFFYSKTPEHDLDASFNFSAEYRQDVAGQEGEDGVQVGINYMKKLSLACGIPDTGFKLLDREIKKFKFLKNPKCYKDNGKLKANLYDNNTNEHLEKHGLVYDLETDKFVAIKQ